MKNLFVLLFLALSCTCFAQVDKNVSVFHRLLIYNADNELMLVNIKDTDVWVTPGFYQDSTLFIKEELINVASTYGMKVSNPELKGVFSMRRENGERKEILIRNMYSCNYLGGDIHFPENQSFEIGEIKWLPLEEALLAISFESIRIFIKQTHDNPNVVWGGSISVERIAGKLVYNVEEEFYPLFDGRKKRKRRKRKT